MAKKSSSKPARPSVKRGAGYPALVKAISQVNTGMLASTHGPVDAWRWCHVVDPETNAIHPPELAAVPGAFSGPEVGPI